jgi:hypothetical protein
MKAVRLYRKILHLHKAVLPADLRFVPGSTNISIIFFVSF